MDNLWIMIWLAVSTSLKNMSSSIGMIIPNMRKNKKCSKPPIRDAFRWFDGHFLGVSGSFVELSVFPGLSWKKIGIKSTKNGNSNHQATRVSFFLADSSTSQSSYVIMPPRSSLGMLLSNKAYLKPPAYHESQPLACPWSTTRLSWSRRVAVAKSCA